MTELEKYCNDNKLPLKIISSRHIEIGNISYTGTCDVSEEQFAVNALCFIKRRIIIIKIAEDIFWYDIEEDIRQKEFFKELGR